MTFLILGIDAATWTIIKPNLNVLPNFQRLCKMGSTSTIHLNEKPISASVWCSMFSGLKATEHKHYDFIKNGKIVKREDLKIDFIWDILSQKGYDVKAVNVPFVVPPYSYSTDWEPAGFGLPITPEEWTDELKRLTMKTIELIKTRPDVLIVVYTLLDRIQHHHWGEPIVLQWYQKIDKKLGEMLFETNFLSQNENKLILISDHGFCSFGEAPIQTLPRKTNKGEIKGDHHPDAILITIRVDHKITQPQDVFQTIHNIFLAHKIN